jgi:dTDP-4-amino-4,6-dideoxygalactose transaminase
MNIERIVTPPHQLNNYYKYTFFLPNDVSRDEFKSLCRQKGVAYGGEVYWPPLHLQPVFQEFLSKESQFNTAEKWGRRMVNPPMFSQMTNAQADRVITVTRDVLSELGRRVK